MLGAPECGDLREKSKFREIPIGKWMQVVGVYQGFSTPGCTKEQRGGGRVEGRSGRR